MVSRTAVVSPPFAKLHCNLASIDCTWTLCLFHLTTCPRLLRCVYRKAGTEVTSQSSRRRTRGDRSEPGKKTRVLYSVREQQTCRSRLHGARTRKRWWSGGLIWSAIKDVSSWLVINRSSRCWAMLCVVSCPRLIPGKQLPYCYKEMNAAFTSLGSTVRLENAMRWNNIQRIVLNSSIQRTLSAIEWTNIIIANCVFEIMIIILSMVKVSWKFCRIYFVHIEDDELQIKLYCVGIIQIM